ncbi:MAG: flagellar biosynthetic protein FliQ [Cyanobacteria bacterium]|jgi:flagellar biosynthesis protein FliQ|nr:flagellar biosynthetic protein FliQ [Cyanobacteriota bacterium]
MDIMMEHLGQGMGLILILSLPSVLTAAAIGLVIGILQAVTQVQEQTISAAPKIVGVFLLLLLTGGLMMNMLSDYSRESIHIAFEEVPGDGEFILPRRPQTEAKARYAEFFKDKGSFPIESHNKGRVASLKASSNGPGGDDGGAANSAVVHTQVNTTPKPGIAEQLFMKKNP